MGKVDSYREALKNLEEWDQYLLDESCLLGPRANLELVAAVAEEGKRLLEKWFSNEDKDIRWIMKENLRKDRLTRLDPDWTRRWKLELGVK